MGHNIKTRIVLFPEGMPKSKRLLDLGLIGLTFPIWGIIWLITASIVYLTIGKPVYFRQIRQGYQGNSFEVLKFRTMTEERDENGVLKPDAERLKKTGQLLRSFSLDEIPQLWVVLKGEMTLVGPRPLPTAYDKRYNAEQRRRFEVYPGVTGLAQIHGRNQVEWEDRFRLDVQYVDSQSFWGDVDIIGKTILLTVFRTYTSGEGETFSKPFNPDGPS